MNVMKIASSISGIIVLLYSILLLFQIWGSGISADIFFKITISSIFIIIILMGLAVMYREYIEDKNMRDDDYLM
ncbi:hypothetical protein MNB_SV-9-681 [hydrothermal vent metagenome]|uniref:Uncharacterized protein n=1 Tax=hydrothermal vent metagenome TaxID=652676 RepID=A0A1W1BVS9_9ZZZZ